MDHGLELIIARLEILEIWFFCIFGRLEILEIWVCNILQNPGNITQTQNPIPDPNPYPFLDPGRVIPGIAGGPGPGIAGGPGPGRRAHPETQTHWGGYAPPDPPSGFFGTGGVQRHIFLASYFINPHPASYFINVLFY